MNHVENTEVTTDLIGERWSKLIINNMNNAIAGLTGLGAAEVRTTSEPRRVSIHLGAETAQVAQAFGHSLQPVMGVTADSLIDAINGRNVEETETAIMESGRYVAGGRPSFGQDVLKGRSTEIDDLNGYVSRKGREAGISTPFNDRIVEIVHDLGVGFKAKPENLQPLVDMLEG
jgi:2-dehydropantoate 2-reductase